MSPRPVQRQGEGETKITEQKERGIKMPTELCCCLAKGRAALSPRVLYASQTGGSSAPSTLDPMPEKGEMWD